MDVDEVAAVLLAELPDRLEVANAMLAGAVGQSVWSCRTVEVVAAVLALVVVDVDEDVAVLAVVLDELEVVDAVLVEDEVVVMVEVVVTVLWLVDVEVDEVVAVVAVVLDEVEDVVVVVNVVVVVVVDVVQGAGATAQSYVASWSSNFFVDSDT